MEPTLRENEFFFVDKLSLRFRPPKRSEIVVLKPPADTNKEYVKRVIAISGDTLEIKNKKVFLNNSPVTEDYVIFKRPGELLNGDNIGPLTVPDDFFFVMGDNRDESCDSRDFVDSSGEHIYFIARSELRGRLIRFK